MTLNYASNHRKRCDWLPHNWLWITAELSLWVALWVPVLWKLKETDKIRRKIYITQGFTWVNRVPLSVNYSIETILIGCWLTYWQTWWLSNSFGVVGPEFYLWYDGSWHTTLMWSGSDLSGRAQCCDLFPVSELKISQFLIKITKAWNDSFAQLNLDNCRIISMLIQSWGSLCFCSFIGPTCKKVDFC